jgi:putative endonuclease
MANNIDKRTAKRKLGDLGEGIACQYLEKQGFLIIDRNYLRKWGELDIVTRKGNIIRFIEVKSVSREVTPETRQASVTHGTKEGYRAEDNMHPWKLKRLSRAIQTYILEKRLDHMDWQLDVVTVKIDEKRRVARVEMIENIVIG